MCQIPERARPRLAGVSGADELAERAGVARRQTFDAKKTDFFAALTRST
ncbi:MAG: hypothetical protein IT176_04075 [Acidobacteria bacterium]|nr:hypothetical protein [Acidobacteriota bacterium]